VTDISFHFNAPHKLAYACRLLRKAQAQGARLVVTGDPDTLRELDAALWTFSAQDFVPHCLAAAATPQVLAASPIVLTETPREAPHQQVLVNLGLEVPAGFESFERLVEVVASGDEDRLPGRRRWKHYADRGYAITRHDLGGEPR
jgi:DNA polymerase-3 subunit chi